VPAGLRCILMLSPCPECAYPLWSEVRRHGAFRFVVYFDNDERSGTYAEQVRVCPDCGSGLASHATDRHGLSLRARVRRLVVYRDPHLR
jgi:ssDNA-binding Zn-finger/Zn-ribbon topoisomerase 1